MFEKIVLRRSEQGKVITLGELAQAMFFYEQVHIVFERDTLINLVRAIGTFNVLALLDRKNISAVYMEDDLAVPNLSLAYKHFNFSSFTIVGNSTSATLPTPEDRLTYQMTQWCNLTKSTAYRFAVNFFKKVRVRKYDSDYFVSKGIINAAKLELTDTPLLHETARTLLVHFLGTQEIGAFKIEAKPTSKGFTIDTDIDFSQKRFQNLITNNTEPLTLPYLLLQILMAKSDNLISAFYDGDIYTSAVSSQIIGIRHKEILIKVTGNQDAQANFEEVILQGATPIRELMNSQQRTFEEFLNLLDKSEPLRAWTKSLAPDKNLVAEYMNNMNAKSWLNSSTAKTIRFLICSTIGVVNTPAGIALSAADTFLVDKLSKGWRPHQFVEKDLKPFVKT